MKALILLVIAAASTSLTACASVDVDQVSLASASRSPAAASPFMPIGAVIDAPRGYTEMCRDRPQLCDDASRVEASIQRSRTMITASTDGQVAGGRPVFDANAEAVTEPKPLLTTWASPSDLRSSWARRTEAVDLSFARVVQEPPAFIHASFESSVASVGTDRETQPAPLPISTRLKMLESVDRYVNGHVRQIPGLEVHGVPDYWDRSGTGPGAAGDCKDLAIEKRLELIEQGYPAKDLFYAVAYRTDMGLHALLIAHTEIGDLVLDSRTPYIVLWNRAPYTWVKRQSPSDPSIWALIDLEAPSRANLLVASLDPSQRSAASFEAR